MPNTLTSPQTVGASVAYFKLKTFVDWDDPSGLVALICVDFDASNNPLTTGPTLTLTHAQYATALGGGTVSAIGITVAPSGTPKQKNFQMAQQMRAAQFGGNWAGTVS